MPIIGPTTTPAIQALLSCPPLALASSVEVAVSDCLIAVVEVSEVFEVFEVVVGCVAEKTVSRVMSLRHDQRKMLRLTQSSRRCCCRGRIDTVYRECGPGGTAAIVHCRGQAVRRSLEDSEYYARSLSTADCKSATVNYEY